VKGGGFSCTCAPRCTLRPSHCNFRANEEVKWGVMHIWPPSKLHCNFSADGRGEEVGCASTNEIRAPELSVANNVSIHRCAVCVAFLVHAVISMQTRSLKRLLRHCNFSVDKDVNG
jgi:hypothetical protein